MSTDYAGRAAGMELDRDGAEGWEGFSEVS